MKQYTTIQCKLLGSKLFPSTLALKSFREVAASLLKVVPLSILKVVPLNIFASEGNTGCACNSSFDEE